MGRDWSTTQLYHVGRCLTESPDCKIGATALNFALMREDLSMVRFLIEEAGADLELKDCYSRPPVYFAFLADSGGIGEYFRGLGLVEVDGSGVCFNDYV